MSKHINYFCLPYKQFFTAYITWVNWKLAFLPFNGWEIRILSLLLVIGTIIILAQEIKECKIEEKDNKKEKENCCK